VGSRAGLDGSGKSRPHQDLTLDRPALSQSVHRLLHKLNTCMEHWSTASDSTQLT
jgi:hypothetical protein